MTTTTSTDGIGDNDERFTILARVRPLATTTTTDDRDHHDCRTTTTTTMTTRPWKITTATTLNDTDDERR